MEYKYNLILFIFLIGLTISIILSITAIPPVCAEGCDLVRTSKYAEIFGIKNSIYGTIIFTFLSILTLTHIKKPSIKKKAIIHSSIIVGTLITLYFIYLQAIVLKAYCKYCLVVDFSMLLAFGMIFAKEKQNDKTFIRNH